MKKFLGLMAVLAVTAMVSSSVFAIDVTPGNPGKFTATASFAGVANFSFVLKNVQGDAETQNLDWTSPDAFVMGSTVSWVRADQYAVVAATITKAGYAVYMNTNNKATNPNLQPNEWKDSSGTVHNTYGGLVRNGGNGGKYRGYIPVFFSYVPTKNASIEFDGKETVTSDRCDRSLSDISNDGYDKNYTTIAALNGPTFFTKDEKGNDVQYPSTKVQGNTAYMYFFGGFKDVIGGDTYSTSVNVVIEVDN